MEQVLRVPDDYLSVSDFCKERAIDVKKAQLMALQLLVSLFHEARSSRTYAVEEFVFPRELIDDVVQLIGSTELQSREFGDFFNEHPLLAMRSIVPHFVEGIACGNDEEVSAALKKFAETVRCDFGLAETSLVIAREHAIVLEPEYPFWLLQLGIWILRPRRGKVH